MLTVCTEFHNPIDQTFHSKPQKCWLSLPWIFNNHHSHLFTFSACHEDKVVGTKNLKFLDQSTDFHWYNIYSSSWPKQVSSSPWSLSVVKHLCGYQPQKPPINQLTAITVTLGLPFPLVVLMRASFMITFDVLRSHLKTHSKLLKYSRLTYLCVLKWWWTFIFLQAVELCAVCQHSIGTRQLLI